MIIKQLLESLRFTDGNMPIRCRIGVEGHDYPIYVLCQVMPNIPGVILETEELKSITEKHTGMFFQELTTFDEKFESNAFHIQWVHDLDQTFYELRHYALIRVEIIQGHVTLIANDEDTFSLRKKVNKQN